MVANIIFHIQITFSLRNIWFSLQTVFPERNMMLYIATLFTLELITKMLNLLSQHSLIPRKGNHDSVTKKKMIF